MNTLKQDYVAASIIIPVFNGEAFLERTIKSCMDQSLKEIEILIVDDNSSDNSIAVATELAKRDPRIKVIHSDNNLGFCKNANCGIKAAKGEFLLVLGQDDLLSQNHIEEMIKCFSADVAMVYCNCSLIDENDEVYETCAWKNREVFVDDFVRANAVSSCGAMLRKLSVESVGGYPEFDDYPNYGEWYLWIMLLSAGRIVPCDKVIALYRRHKNNISNTFSDRTKMKALNHYWTKCRKLAIKCSHKPWCVKLGKYLRAFLSSLRMNIKYYLS